MAFFDLKAPCNNCPFRRSQACNYQLSRKRLIGIVYATAFECHKTTGVIGERKEPQQCAGLMALLHDAQTDNTIMQVATRLSDQTFDHIDRSDTFTTLSDMFKGHNAETRDD